MIEFIKLEWDYYQCSECGAVFKKIGKCTQRHIQWHEKNPKSFFLCPLCLTNYSYKSHFQSHMDWHNKFKDDLPVFKNGITCIELREKYGVIETRNFSTIKSIVWKRQNGLCYSCQKDLKGLKNPAYCDEENCVKDKYFEYHHIKSLKDMGTNHPSNIILLCRNCHIQTFRSDERSGMPERMKNKKLLEFRGIPTDYE